ncbi:MAG TPA: hypothetical protein VFG46_28870 [Chryseolinea sp.]|nr:hypothetical protein [Chryseolinea sp.]
MLSDRVDSNKNAQGMPSLCSENGNVIGFHGRQMNGQVQITDHQTSGYVWKAEEIRPHQKIDYLYVLLSFLST